MDNPRSNGFLVVGRHLLRAGVGALIVLANPAYAADTEAPAPQQTEESRPASTVAVQKIQRLLKLLADRYPERYSSVDPGSLDGVLGENTKIALRNFRAIAGLTKDPRPDTELTPDILSELAQMAADPNAPRTGRVTDCAHTPSDAACMEMAAPAGVAAPASATGSAAAHAPQPDGPKVEETEPNVKPGLAGQPAVAPPPQNVLLYFVQVASLRSADSAQKEWARIKEENRAALRGEQVYIEKADIKGRGIFHRILIGPLPNRNDANTLCGFLTQNGQTCVVTQRNSAELQQANRRNAEESKQGAGRARIVPSQKPDPPRPSGNSSDPEKIGEPAELAPVPHAGTQPQSPVSMAASNPDAADARADTIAVVPMPVPVYIPPPVEVAPIPDPPGPVPTPAAPAIPEPAAPLPREAVSTPNAEPRGATTSGGRLQPKTAPSHTPITAAPSKDFGDYTAATTRDSAKAEARRPAVTKAEPSTQENGSANGRTFVGKLQDFMIPAALAIILVAGGLLYRAYRRRGRTTVPVIAGPGAAATGEFQVLGLEEERSDEMRSLSLLQDAFESQRLQDSRRVRDEFLRTVLADDGSNPTETESRDSAIRVNSKLKMLLATDPSQYKCIFLNLIFLSKVGAALNRKDIALEQLNDRFSREFELLHSYFKIHLLELDDRHRIRKELPGLFYCLQLSQLHKREGRRQFSAA